MSLSDTLLYLLYQAAGQAPMIPLDDHLRPQWLFAATVHEGCNRAGYYERGEFAETYDWGDDRPQPTRRRASAGPKPLVPQTLVTMAGTCRPTAPRIWGYRRA